MKLFSRFSLLLLAAVLLLSAGCVKPQEPTDEVIVSGDAYKAAEIPDDNNRVFYEIFVGSFSDSNGDGIGDLRGIINRMDYLNDGKPDSGLSLGIEGIWLTPIFASNSYHKYNVNDFYKVDPQFGTKDDLVELITLCHERGVKLILDLPINHTSRQCEWFQKFKAAHQSGDVSNSFYNFYSWYDKNTDRAPGGRTFSQLTGSHYYECNFDGDMPELNFDSEQVRSAVLEIAKYYLDLGIDGFRFDAAKYIYFGDNPSSSEFWIWYLKELRKINPDVYTVAEVWDSDGVTDIYYPATNCFDFTMAGSSGIIAQTANRGDVNRLATYVESYLKKVQSLRSSATIVPFIANHDSDRAAGYLLTANGTMQMAANLYLLGPGSPFIYYGEEIGMRGSRGSANTDANRRLAMVWGDEDTVRDPQGTTYASSSQITSTVVDQKLDESSLYTYDKKLLMIRRANPEIAHGTYTALKSDGTKLGGFEATYNGSTVLVLHNTAWESKTIDLSTRTDRVPSALRAVIGAEDATLSGTTLTIGAQTSVVIACK